MNRIAVSASERRIAQWTWGARGARKFIAFSFCRFIQHGKERGIMPHMAFLHRWFWLGNL
jgi:hypothetical protein